MSVADGGSCNLEQERTPLWLAAAHGHVKTVEALLQAGADTTATDLDQHLLAFEVTTDPEIEALILVSCK